MEPHETDLKSIFCEAVEHPAGPDRLAYLERACGADPALRAKVEELLAAHDGAGGFLGSSPGTATDGGATVDAPDPPVDLPTSDARPLSEGPGSRIGPYKLLQEIGQGGMGAVFMAEQDRPVRRRVALKVIKAGMDTAQVVARFEAERQALALMDHPNIARVFDVGTTDGGRPFFVMELVKGIPITQFCDEERLSPRERLELFIPVCQAIQHAHQKGIIHRDVKPTNVLVTLIDGKPVPKVIDFGIAKATDQRLTEKSLFTEFGAIVGTLEYMSPEQANLSALDVDTRSDVYALGVLLYELLTGSTPLERHRLREAGYVEILRRIKEEEPPKPSTRLSGSGERLASIAAVRGVDPGRLTRTVRGDLDWIVMKALEKVRTRRYESAGGFARDVQRYLDGDAVEACPSSSYRMRKFVGKHRVGLATAAAFAALLIAGTAVSLAMAVRVARERDRAVLAESEAKSEGEKSRRSAEESRAVLKFFQEQVLAAARPEGQEGGLGREVTIRQAVDAAGPRIGEAFHDQPTVEAGVREAMGTTYYYLGEWSMAIRELERAAALFESKLGPDHPDTLTCRSTLAVAYEASGQTAEAIALHEATLKALETKFGPDHPNTLTSRNNLAEAYFAAGRLTEATALHQATLKAKETKLGPDHPDTLASRNNLAMAYLAAGRLTEAIALHQATLKAKETKLGPDHPDTLLSRNNLAVAYREAGRLAEAIALLEPTLKAIETKLGPGHPYTFRSRTALLSAYEAAGRTADAESLLREALEQARKSFGPADPRTAGAMAQLGGNLIQQRRWSAAEPVLRECLAIREKVQPDDWSTFNTRSMLGGSLAGQKKYAEAEPLILAGYEGLKARQARIPPVIPTRLPEAADRVIELYESWGKAEEAAGWRGRLAPRSPSERLGLAQMSYDKKRFSAAARVWSEALEADPKLGEDRRAPHRYNAACAAALAAAGKGVDEPPPDEAAKARLRGQALGWLQAELAAWSRMLETGPAQVRPAIAQALDHWQYDPDLEGIREAQALAKLPEAERKEWQSLWATYASLLERTRGKTP